MRRTYLSLWAALALVVGLAPVLLTGCGGSDTTASASSTTPSPAAISAQEIIDQSNAAMADVTSASFTADMAMNVQGDATKMEDPAAQALLGKGVKLHVEGARATDPLSMDADMSLTLGSQILDLGLLAQDANMWVSYQNQWYKVDKKNAAAVNKQTKRGAAPTEQLKSFGLDPAEWGTDYKLVGTEKAADGTPVYHVQATVDPQKLAAALVEAADDPDVAKALGDDATAAQLKQALKQNRDDLTGLQKSLKDVAADYWIGVEDMLLRKAEFTAVMDMTSQRDMEGIEGMTLDMSVTMDDFNEPVTVTAPAGAKSFDKLTEQMFGGMMMGF